jgi:uncharacterized membrane protein
VVFDLLDPIPFGLFVAALIFDVVYDRTAEMLWIKSAAWLITIALFFAIVPRLINLVRVGFPGASGRRPGEVASFWITLLGLVAAIVNAFVHTRDAYATMPDGMLLSLVTVMLLIAARVVLTLQRSKVEA